MPLDVDETTCGAESSLASPDGVCVDEVVAKEISEYVGLGSSDIGEGNEVETIGGTGFVLVLDHRLRARGEGKAVAVTVEWAVEDDDLAGAPDPSTCYTFS